MQFDQSGLFARLSEIRLDHNKYHNQPQSSRFRADLVHRKTGRFAPRRDGGLGRIDSLAIIMTEYKDKSDYKEVYERLKSALISKYGDPSADAQTQLVKILTDPSSIGVFIDKDAELEQCVSWVLDNVEIAIFILNDKVEISYNPTNLTEILTTGGL